MRCEQIAAIINKLTPNEGFTNAQTIGSNPQCCMMRTIHNKITDQSKKRSKPSGRQRAPDKCAQRKSLIKTTTKTEMMVACTQGHNKNKKHG